MTHLHQTYNWGNSMRPMSTQSCVCSISLRVSIHSLQARNPNEVTDSLLGELSTWSETGRLCSVSSRHNEAVLRFSACFSRLIYLRDDAALTCRPDTALHLFLLLADYDKVERSVFCCRHSSWHEPCEVVASNRDCVFAGKQEYWSLALTRLNLT